MAGITSATRFNDDADRLRYGEKRFFERNVLIADSNFLYFFHFPLKKGNAKEALKGENSIVLTEETAFKYFGDEEPLGKTMHYGSNQPMTVTGIVAAPPPNSQIQFDAVVPMDYLKKVARENWGLPEVDNQWLGGWMMTYVKLADPND